MAAYYNEIDPLKAEVLRVAIRAGAIAHGDVDERSIKDIDPAELMGYTQCHFFAGGGFWSLALRLAGWPDDRPVWTGSCPCPSFSAAGKGEGFDDPRHLWPAWAKLIRVCRPPTIFGEQADDAVGFGWLDLVQTDMEAETYSVGKAVLGTASVGGADIRQRLYFVAHGESDRCGEERAHSGRLTARDRSQALTAGYEPSSNTGILGHAGSKGLQERIGDGRIQRDSLGSSEGQAIECGSDLSGLADARHESRPSEQFDESRIGTRWESSTDDGAGSGQCSAPSWLGDTNGYGREQGQPTFEAAGHRNPSDTASSESTRSSPLNGPWRDADWLLCRDGKWRPVEGGTFPLAHGDPARLGRLRLYGDAINIEVAKTFIESYLDTCAEMGA